MATLQEIENVLNIEIGDKRLRPGKKRNDKNKYYYFPDQYYIVMLTKGKWAILEDCKKTRQLLRLYIWYCCNAGYAKTQHTRFHHETIQHEDGLFVDHINNRRYDNRHDNLRVVTRSQNNRNCLKSKRNTSGKQGVDRCVIRGRPYWRVQIYTAVSKRINKTFSIKKFGEESAKARAIAKRIELECQYGYLGD
jgi:hypothetical protein